MRSGGQTSRVASAWRAAASADMLLFLVDSHRQATNADPRVVDLAAALTPELEKACYTEASGAARRMRTRTRTHSPCAFRWGPLAAVPAPAAAYLAGAVPLPLRAA